MVSINPCFFSIYKLLVCFIAIVFMGSLASCSGTKTLPVSNRLINSNCFYSPLPEGKYAPDSNFVPDSKLLDRFSEDALFIAHITGLKKKLERLYLAEEEIKRGYSLSARLELNEVRQQIDHHISHASLQVSALASVLECEDERADQVASYLLHQQNKAQQHLTVAAITIGAVTAIASGIVYSRRPDAPAVDGIGIVGGIAEVLIGIRLLLLSKKVDFWHQQNHLREIWYGPKSSDLYPPFIWAYLNSVRTDSEVTIREQIIDKWIGLEQLASEDKKEHKRQVALYFGKGGKYSADDLTNRANMLDQLEAQVSLLKQGLSKLSYEIYEQK
ncbi:hypothetical protein RCC89_16840 [Cytophagaceae bacterium ABcell3]|nr:hypothetical protein RCC89_16840 [Cytophagaceae bacterium ABcell3]